MIKNNYIKVQMNQKI